MISTIVICILTTLLILALLSSYAKGKKIESIVENLIIHYETESSRKEYKARFGSLMNPHDYE